jgi:nucleoside-diphosphate-sugar epimerase
MVGCGDLGARIARGLSAAGNEVFTLTRSAEPGTRALRGDVTRAASLPPLPERLGEIVYCLTPSARDEAAYRAVFVDGLRNLIARLDVPVPICFVSSTAVYGDADGGWLDETAAPAPAAFNGRVLLDAEAIALAAHPSSKVLRLGGIYGPGRDSLLRQARAGTPPSMQSLQWGNRIHVDDAAAAACHLIESGATGVFNVVDDSPAPQAEVIDWLRMRLALPSPRTARTAPGGRRIANTRLRASGFAPRHPDYRSGYAELLGDDGR